MRERFFRVTAAILGFLAIPSLILNIYTRGWPADQWDFYLLAGEVVILYVFLSYGLGIGPMAMHGYSASDSRLPAERTP